MTFVNFCGMWSTRVDAEIQKDSADVGFGLYKHELLQWRQLGGWVGGGGGGGLSPPRFLQIFFSVVSLIQCSKYVHAYQALVHFSTWIYFYRGANLGLLAWRCKKKFPPRHKNFLPPQEMCELAPLNYYCFLLIVLGIVFISWFAATDHVIVNHWYYHFSSSLNLIAHRWSSTVLQSEIRGSSDMDGCTEDQPLDQINVCVENQTIPTGWRWSTPTGVPVNQIMPWM